MAERKYQKPKRLSPNIVSAETRELFSALTALGLMSNVVPFITKTYGILSQNNPLRFPSAHQKADQRSGIYYPTKKSDNHTRSRGGNRAR